MLIRNIFLLVCTLYFFSFASCKDTPNPAPVPPVNDGPAVSSWITSGDQSKLLEPQTQKNFSTSNNGSAALEVNTGVTFQSMDGFGYTLTGASAILINNMGAAERSALLNDLFSSNGIGVSYLRISIGASDLDTAVFSYNDLPAGQTDPGLAGFSIARDRVNLIPVLKAILQINPSIKILGSPWSPPAWMKTNNSSIGGNLQAQYYNAYAQYFVKYIQAYRAEGIAIDAITIQNEPHHPGNNPSMYMSATEQANFIKNNLGPAFAAAGINTRIIIWDHNADEPDYPVTVLNDAQAKQYIDGSAFHLYAGNISALSQVRNAHPDKNLYFTEQYTASNGQFNSDFMWHIKNLIIGAPRNWAKNVLEWNLANDPAFAMHTPGGCTTCKGALTINGNSVTKNVSYYIIAQASKFVPAGSVRVESTAQIGNLYSVAFKRPDGKTAMIVLNDSNSSAAFNIKNSTYFFPAVLPAYSAGTYVW